MRQDDVCATYEELTGYTPRDMRWYIVYAALRHGIVMAQVTRRAVAFGEAEMPDDPDDLIMHKPTLVRDDRRHLLGQDAVTRRRARATRPGADGGGHPDDELHAPTTDDPAWSETCWFTFTVPERKLSGQFYPYFLANLGVVGGRRVLLGPVRRHAGLVPLRQELLAPAVPDHAAHRPAARQRAPVPLRQPAGPSGSWPTTTPTATRSTSS